MRMTLISCLVLSVGLIGFQCLYAHDEAFPLPSGKINEYPFNMVGKIASGDLFSGSGTAISQKVVLAAAHSFFDKKALDWEPGPFQWNRRHSPSNRNYDISTRSYRYFSDYAEAVRQFNPGEGESSFEEFNRDVITLIFFEDVANGGHAGWSRYSLDDDSDKMIVGYPNLNYSNDDLRRHRMHSTSLSGSRARYRLSYYDDGLGSDIIRIYHTYDLSSGPGSSGGPVFGLIDFSTGTDWGVVGIHVGGIIGESALAVGIDQDVYDLIKEAELATDSVLPDDHGDSRKASTMIELNHHIPGNLEIEGDVDYFRFSIHSAGTVTIFTTGITDTFGMLQNSLGNLVVANDDGGTGENFSITRALDPGTYYIGVNDFSNNETGPYSLHVDFNKATNSSELVLSGSGIVVGEDIQHPSGTIFDQVLLTGPYIKLQAKPEQITRVSFLDENEDIVQVEFYGTGTFTVTLDSATFLPAALPPRYNQQVEYVTGKPSMVIEGADSSTFFSIFTVGRINAVNQALFPKGQVYDAEADVTLVEVINSTGFGGMQFSNAVFFGKHRKSRSKRPWDTHSGALNDW